jgi:hypothetical protein
VITGSSSLLFSSGKSVLTTFGICCLYNENGNPNSFYAYSYSSTAMFLGGSANKAFCSSFTEDGLGCSSVDS